MPLSYLKALAAEGQNRSLLLEAHDALEQLQHAQVNLERTVRHLGFRETFLALSADAEANTNLCELQHLQGETNAAFQQLRASVAMLCEALRQTAHQAHGAALVP
ncbi:MAG TPA: hypothetical protein VIL09_00250 [Microvirga sp.]|jgi:hypothetical protein